MQYHSCAVHSGMQSPGIGSIHGVKRELYSIISEEDCLFGTFTIYSDILFQPFRLKIQN